MAWTAREQQERRRQAIEQHPGRQHVTTRCLHCNSRQFKHIGTLWEGQAALAQHRTLAHPELPPLEQLRKQTRRAQRKLLAGAGTYRVSDETQPRHLADQEELHEREILRRMVRSDLPAMKA